MCRIASLFLLQRLKGCMSGDAHDFNNMETWAVIKFFFLQGKAPKEIHVILTETLGEHARLYATVRNWVAQFKHGDFSTCVVPHPERPKTVTTPEIIDQIHELILEDRRISAKSIAEQLGISRERVGSIIHEGLDMRKLSAEWVPKCLNANQECQRCQSSEQLLWSNDFRSRLVTMDETWLYHYDPETKQQSMEWRHSGSPCPKKFWVKKSAWKVLPSIFLGSRRHPPHRLSSKGPNYQRGVLLISAGAIEGHFEGETPREGHQGGLVLARQMPRLTRHLQPRRNWPTWASSVLITDPILQIWPHRTTTCSLDWMKQLKGRHFSSDTEVIAAAKTWLDGQPSEFFLSGLQKLEQWAKKCIKICGEYV